MPKRDVTIRKELSEFSIKELWVIALALRVEAAEIDVEIVDRESKEVCTESWEYINLTYTRKALNEAKQEVVLEKIGKAGQSLGQVLSDTGSACRALSSGLPSR